MDSFLQSVSNTNQNLKSAHKDLSSEYDNLLDERNNLRKELSYAISSLELIEKLQSQGNTVSVKDVVNRLKSAL